MCVARTARRRRKQAKNHYRHLTKGGKGGGNSRPIYKKHSAEYYRKKLTRVIDKQKKMAMRKAMSKRS